MASYPSDNGKKHTENPLQNNEEIFSESEYSFTRFCTGDKNRS